jgi:pyrroline-5-carboxylate reductase
MTNPVIAIIGTGNMGHSLIAGLIKSEHPHDKLWAADPSEEKLAVLQEKFSIQVTTENKEAINNADIVILAVKPQLFFQVAQELTPVIKTRKPLIISIAAGIRITDIEKCLGQDTAIVRAMPNTPAMIGCGATALFANSNVSHAQHNQAESILRAAGVVVWLEKENLMDVVTALSGSGPAYFFLIMEALQQAAVDLGLPEDTARLLTLQTALGSVRMCLESETPLTELRRQVTSPGGTTEKAIFVLEEHNIRGLLQKALHAAKQRSEELALGEKK